MNTLRADVPSYPVTYEEALSRCVDFITNTSGFCLVGIDGRSGSGKTSLCSQLVSQVNTPCSVLPLDDVYPGWHGLRAGISIAQGLIEELGAGRHASYTPHHWPGTASRASGILSPKVPLIVEGVGATLACSSLTVNLTVWLEMSEEQRKSRALHRDGATYEPYWDVWAGQENALLQGNYSHAKVYVQS